MKNVMKNSLKLTNLHKRHPGISLGISVSYTEAACVCLDRHHKPPVELVVDERSEPLKLSIEWKESDHNLKRAWANEIDTTEAGAYCLALATVEVTDDLVAISRAETKTGADYYLGTKNKAHDDLEDLHRLEVSGINNSDSLLIKNRLQQKIKQAQLGRSNLPAIAAVVGFSSLQIAIADVPEK